MYNRCAAAVACCTFKLHEDKSQSTITTIWYKRSCMLNKNDAQ